LCSIDKPDAIAIYLRIKRLFRGKDNMEYLYVVHTDPFSQKNCKNVKIMFLLPVFLLLIEILFNLQNIF
jgi:hypothetical protein